MRKLQIADGEVMQIAIQWETGRNEESRDDRRLHGPPRVTAGRPRRQVTELFDEDDDATLGCAARLAGSPFNPHPSRPSGSRLRSAAQSLSGLLMIFSTWLLIMTPLSAGRLVQDYEKAARGLTNQQHMLRPVPYCGDNVSVGDGAVSPTYLSALR